MVEDQDFESHEKLRDRVSNEMDSVLWTYKEHFKASTCLSRLDKGINILITIFGGAITASLIGNYLSFHGLLILSVSIIVLSGVKSAINLPKIAQKHFQFGKEYHELFKDYKNYVDLKLAKEEYELSEMEKEYKKLHRRQKELNRISPHISGIWHKLLDKSIYEEVETCQRAKNCLTGHAKLKNQDSDIKNSED